MITPCPQLQHVCCAVSDCKSESDQQWVSYQLQQSAAWTSSRRRTSCQPVSTSHDRRPLLFLHATGPTSLFRKEARSLLGLGRAHVCCIYVSRSRRVDHASRRGWTRCARCGARVACHETWVPTDNCDTLFIKRLGACPRGGCTRSLLRDAVSASRNRHLSPVSTPHRMAIAPRHFSLAARRPGAVNAVGAAGGLRRRHVDHAGELYCVRTAA